MSKSFLSVLALGGIKGAALQAAVAQVCDGAASAILHGDRSSFTETIRECEGKGAAAVAVRETMQQAADLIGAARTGATWAPSATSPAWAQGFTCPALPPALSARVATVKPGKATAEESAAASTWGRDFGAAWSAAYVLHLSAASASAACRRALSAIGAAVAQVAGSLTTAQAAAQVEGAADAVAPMVATIHGAAAQVAALQAAAEAAALACVTADKPGTHAEAAEAAADATAAHVKTAAEAATAAQVAAAPAPGPDDMQADGAVSVADLIAQIEGLTVALQAAEAARDKSQAAEAAAVRQAEAAEARAQVAEAAAVGHAARAQVAEAAADAMRQAAADAAAPAPVAVPYAAPGATVKGKGKRQAAAVA